VTAFLHVCASGEGVCKFFTLKINNILMKISKIAVAGTGYVGLSLAILLTALLH